MEDKTVPTEMMPAEVQPTDHKYNWEFIRQWIEEEREHKPAIVLCQDDEFEGGDDE